MTPWPALPVREWRETLATFLLFTQIVGKIRLALTPKMNQWWNVPLYVTTRGLTTSPMPYLERTIAIDFDLLDHELLVADSEGRRRALPLVPRTVADFHRELFAVLEALDVHIQLAHGRPDECPVKTPFHEDLEHASYDAEHVERFGRVLRCIEPVFEVFRARFRGKCSPVHFFWGAGDLAVTRFSGKRAPLRKGSSIDRDAYDEEVISLGFWPGDPWSPSGTDAMFYSYTVPEPPEFSARRVRPADAAFYSDSWKEFILPYEAARAAPEPARAILEFAESTYDAGATLAGWPKEVLTYP
jgi:hypothetical protein